MVRIFRHYIPLSQLLLLTVEVAVLFSISLVGFGFDYANSHFAVNLAPGVMSNALLFTSIMLCSMTAVGMYSRGLRDTSRQLIVRTLIGVSIGGVLILALIALTSGLSQGAQALAVSALLAVCGLNIIRSIFYWLSDVGFFKRRILVLGTGDLAAQLLQLKRKTDWRGIELVGFVPAIQKDGVVSAIAEERIVPVKSTLRDLAKEHKIDEIILAMKEGEETYPVRELFDCNRHGVQFTELVRFFEERTAKIKIDALCNTANKKVHDYFESVDGPNLAVKRLFDMLVSSAMLLAVGPIMGITALAIYLSSWGKDPVLYCQERVGKNGKPFKVMKFRSMVVDAEANGAQWAQVNDPRVTKIGSFIRKTRIDELPQLFNVLKGDMSFVGPRPERPQFVSDLGEAIPHYDARHNVNPGITGWAQVCYPYGSSESDAKEKLQYDLYYIKNYSPFLDLMILFQTAQVILFGKGAR